MTERPKRKKRFIKKAFQTDFAVKFLILIAVESALAIALFVYLSRGTVITGYSAGRLVMERTGEYFLPSLLLANLAVIGVTAIAGFVVMLAYSHRIAGPLYRFEQTIDEMSAGDLTGRFGLRAGDQLEELSARINALILRLDSAVSVVKDEAAGATGAIDEARGLLGEGAGADRLEKKLKEASKRLEKLSEAAGFFKTTGGRKG